jgi:hypothetical protein
MKIINLTSESITIDSNNLEVYFIPTHRDKCPYLDINEYCQDSYTICGIPVLLENQTVVKNLPEPQPGVYYIVEEKIFHSAPERYDLLTPDYMTRKDYKTSVYARFRGRKILAK